MSEKSANELQTQNNPKEIRGWMIYDWANSVYYTTVLGVLIAPYLTRLAQASVGENGVVISLGFIGNITAKSLTSFTTVIGVIIQAFLMIFLSAIADYSNSKKRFMMILVYVGVVFACLIFFIEGDNYLWGSLLLIGANVCIGCSLVFYNAYLPEIASIDKRDSVSARGYALGYAGGSLMLVADVALLFYADSLGITLEMAQRICLLAAGLWWGGFSAITFRRLRNHGKSKRIPKGTNIFALAISEIRNTFGKFLKLRYTLLFLFAYLCYNDGIQTVIYQASVFVEQELLIAKGLPPDPIFLVLLFLETQIVALIGALFWERVSARFGAKVTILVSLAWWACVVIYAYAFLRDKNQAWLLGAAIGWVIGGTQSLSRSLYSQIIPKGSEASFFSFYEISEKGTSWMGLLTFSIVVGSTGSYRTAILAVIFFFIVGGMLLLINPIEKAIQQAATLSDEHRA
ncbi:MAG: MFS transporter [Pyrinomonadaceae bacterium]